jgi:hypothetical protein
MNLCILRYLHDSYEYYLVSVFHLPLQYRFEADSLDCLP